MKKLTIILAALTLILCLFAGCGRNNSNAKDDTNVSTTDDGQVNGDNDTTESAGDMIDDAMDATGDVIDDAAEGAEAALDPTDGQPKPDTDSKENDNVADPGAENPDTVRRSRGIIRGTGTPDMVTGKEPAEGNRTPANMPK